MPAVVAQCILPTSDTQPTASLFNSALIKIFLLQQASVSLLNIAWDKLVSFLKFPKSEYGSRDFQHN